MDFDNSTVKILLEKMIKHQETKVLKIAREIIPDLTPEDIKNPQDFTELYKDSVFNYEDGILVNIVSPEKCDEAQYCYWDTSRSECRDIVSQNEDILTVISPKALKNEEQDFVLKTINYFYE